MAQVKAVALIAVFVVVEAVAAIVAFPRGVFVYARYLARDLLLPAILVFVVFGFFRISAATPGQLALWLAFLFFVTYCAVWLLSAIRATMEFWYAPKRFAKQVLDLPSPADADVRRIEAVAAELAGAIGVRGMFRVAAASDFVVAALVLRDRPVLLIDPALVPAVAADELRAILAHEVAHFGPGASFGYGFLRRIEFCTRLLDDQLINNKVSLFRRIVGVIAWFAPDGGKTALVNACAALSLVAVGTFRTGVHVTVWVFREDFSRAEYAADAVAARTVSADALGRALCVVSALLVYRALQRKAPTPTYEPFQAAWRASVTRTSTMHPSLEQRFRRIATQGLDIASLSAETTIRALYARASNAVPDRPPAVAGAPFGATAMAALVEPLTCYG